jgi:hypothetical protein
MRIAWFAVIESAVAGWDVIATMTADANNAAVAAPSTRLPGNLRLMATLPF